MLRRFLQARDGAVAVETALVCSLLLVPLLLGLWDVAQLAMSQAQLDEALQDATTYVAYNNNATAAQITSAAQGAYGNSISVSSGTVCYCVSTTSSSPTAPTSISCTSSCGSGYQFEQFMSITVSTTVAIPFAVPYLGSSTTLSSTGQVRTA